MNAIIDLTMDEEEPIVKSIEILHESPPQLTKKQKQNLAVRAYKARNKEKIKTYNRKYYETHHMCSTGPTTGQTKAQYAFINSSNVQSTNNIVPDTIEEPLPCMNMSGGWIVDISDQ